VLLALHTASTGETTWTLPGGGVEHGEDPFDAVIREVAEETGCAAVVERLLGVDSRVIPATESRSGAVHQNVGIYYRIRIVGDPRPRPNDDITECTWTPIADVPGLHRSSLVDVGLTLARTTPPTGHLPPLPRHPLHHH
jgi:8-oxo-dGTP diphosphatase